VIEAAPELSALLEHCSNLTLVVTSRELLRVQGEAEYEVPPLASPEAVALFCERARLEPSGEIAELCARLDNLPLAVELAAVRTKALSPAQILERLSQRLDLLRGAGMPMHASRRCGRRSPGATTSSPRKSSASFDLSPSSPAAAPSKPPRMSRTPTLTLCSR